MNGENHAIFLRQGGEHIHTRARAQCVSLSASNDLYINNSRASFFSSRNAGRESMPSRSTTGEV